MSAIVSACGNYRYRLERTAAMRGLRYAFFKIPPAAAISSSP